MTCKIYKQFIKGKRLEKGILIGERLDISKDKIEQNKRIALAMDKSGEQIQDEMIVFDIEIHAHGIFIKGIEKLWLHHKEVFYHQFWYCYTEEGKC